MCDKQYSIFENINKCADNIPCVITSKPFTKIDVHIVASQCIEAIDKRERVNVFCTSIKKSNILKESILKARPHSKIIHLHGDDIKLSTQEEIHAVEKKRIIKNINSETEQCDIFIYTSTITVGVDIQTHFNHTIAILSKCTIDAF